MDVAAGECVFFIRVGSVLSPRPSVDVSDEGRGKVEACRYVVMRARAPTSVSRLQVFQIEFKDILVVSFFVRQWGEPLKAEYICKRTYASK